MRPLPQVQQWTALRRVSYGCPSELCRASLGIAGQDRLYALSLHRADNIQTHRRANPTAQLNENEQLRGRFRVQFHQQSNVPKHRRVVPVQRLIGNFFLQLPQRLEAERSFTSRKECLALQTARAIGEVNAACTYGSEACANWCSAVRK